MWSERAVQVNPLVSGNLFDVIMIQNLCNYDTEIGMYCMYMTLLPFDVLLEGLGSSFLFLDLLTRN